MFRLPGWEARVSEYIVTHGRTRFSYGVLDCGLVVADVIQAMTDIDVVAALRGTYTNRVEAFQAVKSVCGRNTMEAVAAFLAERHGFPEVPIYFAQRGDPVVLRSGRRSSLGFVAMHGTELLTPYKDGLLRLPLNNAIRAYHVG